MVTNPARRIFDTFSADVKGVRLMYDAAIQFVQRNGPWTLVLAGGVGSGKTHIAEAIGWAFLSKGRTVRFEKVSRMIVNLRETQSNDSDNSLQAWLWWYQSRDLLILDDLAVKERIETAWARDVLLTIMDHRLEYGHPMVVTTNCDKAGMEAALGERIASRLYAANPDLKAVALVPVTAGDYRS